MRRSAYLTLVAALVIGAGVVVAAEDQGKPKMMTAIGPVHMVAAASFAISPDRGDMTFAIDANTYVKAQGAGTKTRAKKEAGEGGLAIADVVHVGDQVFVRYAEVGAKFVASEIEVRHRRSQAAQTSKYSKERAFFGYTSSKQENRRLQADVQEDSYEADAGALGFVGDSRPRVAGARDRASSRTDRLEDMAWKVHRVRRVSPDC